MINKVTLLGNLGADPDIRVQESGLKMARLRVATTERIFLKESQTIREHTEWHTVIVWRQLADLADRYLRKG
ncbi:MAG: single-stranded DNA-binding protein, partial [Rikenellaceae bacterium]